MPRKNALMISTFPTEKCGIAAYAHQSVRSYKKNGFAVWKATIGDDSVGDIRFDVNSIGQALRLMRFIVARPWHTLEVHYVDSFHTPSGHWSIRLLRVLANILLHFVYYLKIRNRRLIVHEVTYGKFRLGFDLYRKIVFFFYNQIIFHTEQEHAAFKNHFGSWLGGKGTIEAHNRDFELWSEESQADARTRLGLPEGPTICLCIGFLKKHKRFDLPVQTFAGSGNVEFSAACLYVVGAENADDPNSAGLANQLREASSGISNVNVIDGFLSDIDFDRWIIASDIVILPYDEIWSSGVGARAVMLKKPIVCRVIPSLVEQLSSGKAYTFTSDDDFSSVLKMAMMDLESES